MLQYPFRRDAGQPSDMRAGAKLGHSAPRERCSAAEEKQATAGSCFRELLR
jgi:hypothetical protein